MTSSEFRAEARKNLQGKWGKVALITLCYGLVSFGISFLLAFVPDGLGTIAQFLIEIPLSFGFMFIFLKVYNGEETSSFDFLNLGFDNFSRAWEILFRIILKLIVPLIVFTIVTFISAFILVATILSISTLSTSDFSSSTPLFSFGSILLLFISFIIIIIVYIWLIARSYYYKLAYYIAMENPNMSPVDCVQKSEDLMKGNRAKLFILHLTFIGWYFLAVLSIFIGLFWLIPYFNFAHIAFYKHFAGHISQNKKTTSEPSSDLAFDSQSISEPQSESMVNTNDDIFNADDNPIQKF